jgi:RimJ/RimL family protein N-acetyltransferase
MIALGAKLGLIRIQAHCHVANLASVRVLEKAGMALEGVLRKHSLFPNLSPAPQDVRLYAWISQPPDGIL